MPSNGSTFKDIEDMWPLLKEEPHNLKLLLVVDGVNPFGEMRSVYSVWPIFFINNNIPLWMSIMREHIMLAMIVPGIFLFYSYLRIIISLRVKWTQYLFDVVYSIR